MERKEYKGLNYLRTKLESKQNRIKTRYKYYEMKNRVKDLNISTPPNLLWQQSMVGWCGKAVDSLADRLSFRGFIDDTFNLTQIFNLNNKDVLFDSAILSALIASCSFIYISQDGTGYPRMQVLDGKDATGVVDPITGLLTEGYAVLSRDDMKHPVREVYLTAGNAVFYEKGKKNYSRKNKAPYPLLVPVVFRPDAERPFGHSRISRACMSLVQSALRTVKRSEISAEFYSFPQKYVLGTDPGLEPLDKWRASMSSMLEFSAGENGEKPSVGQFSQQSMEPHLSQLRMFAALFAGETGLTLDDLGFATENPSSAEAIKAAHENLRLTARKAQTTFGANFLNAGYLAACVRDNFSYQRQQFYLTKPTWEPVFESGAAQLSGLGDAVIKIQQAFPGYLDEEKLRELTGV